MIDRKFIAATSAHAMLGTLPLGNLDAADEDPAYDRLRQTLRRLDAECGVSRTAANAKSGRVAAVTLH